MITKGFLLHQCRVDPETGCWEWSGLRSPLGYGRSHGRVVHRIAFTLWRGPIPDGIKVLHKCDNPPCFNPYHLFLGTHADNQKDKVKKGRQAKGDKHGRAILCEDEVRLIRKRRIDGASATILARQFGVTLQQILHVVRRTQWRHVQ